jgi:hypothetical protein
MTVEIILLAILLAAILVLLGRAYVARGGYNPPATPSDWGLDPDDLQWQREATERQHTALKDVRSTAEKWGASVTALLGIFGTVAFVKGPNEFSKLSEDEAWWAFGLIVAAGVLAAAAITAAALSAQGSPVRTEQLDGWTLRSWNEEQLDVAIRNLRISRFTTVLAAAVLFAAMLVTWASAIDKPEEAANTSALFVNREGIVECREVTKAELNKLTAIVEVSIVDSCPK